MKVWAVGDPGPIGGDPLVLIDKSEPSPGPHQIQVRVSVCGVCRTDLHLAEGDLPPRYPNAVPGHEIVGTVDELGEGSTRFSVGDRVGIAWLRKTCGECTYCRSERENLCLRPEFTGWDADGGFAEYAVVDERFAYALPDRFSDEEAAPLLCAGIIGYRSLCRSKLPPHGRLGIYGFGASAHLTAQVAMAQGATVHVRTRSLEAQRLALELGVASAAGTFESTPEPLDSAIVFAPAGEVVPAALSALDRGGTVAVAGIHLSDIPSLNYQRHLFEERSLCSVTANTRRDGQEFLELAARTGLTVKAMSYDFERAPQALRDLAEDRVTGVAVIRL